MLPCQAFGDKSKVTASIHNTAACLDSFESPPTAASISFLQIKANFFASKSSVKAEPHAIDAEQPKTLYPTEVTCPLVTTAVKRKMSPQTGFETSTITAGEPNSPTFRGFLK